METKLSRRHFIDAIVLLVGGLSASLFSLRPSHGAHRKEPVPVASRIGEVLEYRVDCPLIPNIATGKLEFRQIRDSSRFLALLETKVEGMLGLLTLFRRDLFVSVMRWSSKHSRMLPVWYAQQVSRKGSWRRKVLVFHHDRGKYFEYKIYPHRYRKRRKKTLGRILDDPLSAYYNWRIGAFGPLGPGRSQQIDNLARSDPFVLRLQTASTEEANHRKAAEPDSDGKEHLLKAHLDKELMDIVRGNVEGWFDEHWTPISGKATQVKWVGEVSAHLVSKARLPTPELNACPPPPLERKLWTPGASSTD